MYPISISAQGKLQLFRSTLKLTGLGCLRLFGPPLVKVAYRRIAALQSFQSITIKWHNAVNSRMITITAIITAPGAVIASGLQYD
jgi:hypothetical protein